MSEILNFPILVLVVSFLILWASTRIGSSFSQRIDTVHEDFGLILTATLTLLGLIVGFTFSMAVTTYNERRIHEEDEANAIGTEYLRTDFLPAADRDCARSLLRAYLHQRVLFYEVRSWENSSHIEAATDQLHGELWRSVTPAAAQGTPVAALVIAGMNDVLNSEGYTKAAWLKRIPAEAWLLLGVVSMSGNLMIGLYLRQGRTSRYLLLALPAIVSLSLFLIADMNTPRGGLIHIEPRNLIRLSQSFETAGR